MTTSCVFDTIDSALRKSGRLHGFRSGGGLRVLRIDDGPTNVAYAEHPSVDEALRILADDIEAGGRPYSKVYGIIETNYLTGQSGPTSELDDHLLRGNTIDTWVVDGRFVTELSGWGESKLPADLHARALAGESIMWTDTERDVVYRCTPIRFANGDPGYSWRVVSKPLGMPDHRTSMWKTVRRGVGDSFRLSVTNAFAARAVEIKDYE